MVRSTFIVLSALSCAALGCTSNSPIPHAPSSNAVPAVVGTSPQPVNSPAQEVPSLEWPVVKSDDNRFSIEMPTAPQPIKRTVDSPKGPIEFVFYKSRDMQRMFFNFLVITYPQEVLDSRVTPISLLQKLGEGAMAQKKNANSEYARALEGAGCPAFEAKYVYPSGVNGDGNKYMAGYAVHRMYMIDNRVYQVFVDVVDTGKPEPIVGMIQARLDKFFASVKVRADDSTSTPQ